MQQKVRGHCCRVTTDDRLNPGLVQRQQFGKSRIIQTAYAYQQHDHIICNECGHVLGSFVTHVLVVSNTTNWPNSWDEHWNRIPPIYGHCEDIEACEHRKSALK